MTPDAGLIPRKVHTVLKEKLEIKKELCDAEKTYFGAYMGVKFFEREIKEIFESLLSALITVKEKIIQGYRIFLVKNLLTMIEEIILFRFIKT